jgi:hypothetical protein
MVDELQTMKTAATMAMALTRSGRFHRFQSDLKSHIGCLSTSGEFVPELTLMKLASRAMLNYPRMGHAVRGSRGAQGPSENIIPPMKR